MPDVVVAPRELVPAVTAFVVRVRVRPVVRVSARIGVRARATAAAAAVPVQRGRTAAACHAEAKRRLCCCLSKLSLCTQPESRPPPRIQKTHPSSSSLPRLPRGAPVCGSGEGECMLEINALLSLASCHARTRRSKQKRDTAAPLQRARSPCAAPRAARNEARRVQVVCIHACNAPR